MMRHVRTNLPDLIVVVASIAVAAWLWLPQLGASFWLDETGTAWLTQGDLGEVISRSHRYQGGALLFLVVEWVVRRIGGLNEVALRLPSVIGAAAAAFFVYALGRRLDDARTGLIAAALFVCLPSVAFAASDARPYALATMTLVGSGLALTRWVDTGNPRDGAIYAAALAGIVYLHYLFALAFAAHAVFLFINRASLRRLSLRELSVPLGVLALLLLPSVPTFMRVMGDRSDLSNPYLTTPKDVAIYLVPAKLAGTIAVAALVGAFATGVVVRPLFKRLGGAAFVASWIVVPALVLHQLSARTGTNVMVPRYFLMLTPAIPLLLAVFVRRLREDVAQVAVVVIVAFIAATSFKTTQHTAEDWRAAGALQRDLAGPETPVLLFSGFIEAKQIDWLKDPERASYLNAPAAMYPMDGELIPTPFGLDEAGIQYLSEVLQTRLLPADHFVLVTRGTDPFHGWLEPQTSAAGFQSRLAGVFGNEILVYNYQRTGG